MADIDRRKLIVGAASVFLAPRAGRGGTKAGTESFSPGVTIQRLETNNEYINRAVRNTVTSLSDGMRSLHGRRISPRDSGFIHHPRLLQHYAKGMGLPASVPDADVATRVRQRLMERIQISPVTADDMTRFQDDSDESNYTAEKVRQLAASMEQGEVGGFVYISVDRSFQRLYAVRKTGVSALQFLESYPVSTSGAEPQDPTQSSSSSVTPLGIFSIPPGGVRPALLGEVTKIERPDLTRYYFVPLTIDGRVRHFVRNFDRLTGEEMVTITGDTHLIWSPEIDGSGIKIHDTTEIEDLGQSVSSGCIRTPSVRRFTELTSKNSRPTKIAIHWAKSEAERNVRGFGGSFGGEPRKSRRSKKGGRD